MNAPEAETHPDQKGGWTGRLELEYERFREDTVLCRNRHKGPLVVQRPLYPEGKGVCHTCILHPPGGVVGGDRLEIELTLKKDASALITTPGATKFYRSGGRFAVQEQHLKVAKGASLEWLPQDAIIFPGAEAAISTRIDLAAGASFMGWEILCLGLPVNGERFTQGRLQTSLSLSLDNRVLFLDRLRVCGEPDLIRPSGLRNYPVVATFIITNAKNDMLEAVRDIAPKETDALVGATLLHNDLLLIRYLGHSTFAAHALFAEIWTLLRPQIINKIAYAPRIWAT
jgi:urease accessory protein